MTFFFVLNTFSKQNEGQKKQLSEYQQTDLKPFVLTLKRTYFKRPILKVFCQYSDQKRVKRLTFFYLLKPLICLIYSNRLPSTKLNYLCWTTSIYLQWKPTFFTLTANKKYIQQIVAYFRHSFGEHERVKLRKMSRHFT